MIRGERWNRVGRSAVRCSAEWWRHEFQACPLPTYLLDHTPRTLALLGKGLGHSRRASFPFGGVARVGLHDGRELAVMLRSQVVRVQHAEVLLRRRTWAHRGKLARHPAHRGAQVPQKKVLGPGIHERIRSVRSAQALCSAGPGPTCLIHSNARQGFERRPGKRGG